MHVIGGPVNIDRHTIKAVDDAPEIFMKSRTQLISDQRSPFFRRKHYVIEEICVGHGFDLSPAAAGSDYFLTRYPGSLRSPGANTLSRFALNQACGILIGFPGSLARQGLILCLASRLIRDDKFSNIK
jgi:hypothetical protein